MGACGNPEAPERKANWPGDVGGVIKAFVATSADVRQRLLALVLTFTGPDNYDRSSCYICLHNLPLSYTTLCRHLCVHAVGLGQRTYRDKVLGGAEPLTLCFRPMKNGCTRIDPGYAAATVPGTQSDPIGEPPRVPAAL